MKTAWLLGLGLVAACRGKSEEQPASVKITAPALPATAEPNEPPPTDAAPPEAKGFELLGDPLAGYPRLQAGNGRTLWDVEAFGDRLYLGSGDGTVNTGPTDVIAYGLSSGGFRVESTLQEEAIMTIRVLGDRLFIPGVDPMGSPKNGAIHVRRGPGEDAGWAVLTVPDAVHVSDVTTHEGRTFAATQKHPNVAAVLESADDGATWTTHVIPGWRTNALFEIDGRLYASTFGGGASRWEGGTMTWVPSPFGPSGAKAPKPKAGVDRELYETAVDRVVTCGAATWAIVLHGSVGTGYGSSSLVRLSVTDGAITREVASVDGRATDLFVWMDRCHVVTNTELEDDTWRARVLAASEDGVWETMIEVDSPAIVQSATRVRDAYYFGLGCWGGCRAESGMLARAGVPGVVRPKGE